jgi:hypothetical protein
MENNITILHDIIEKIDANRVFIHVYNSYNIIRLNVDVDSIVLMETDEYFEVDEENVFMETSLGRCYYEKIADDYHRFYNSKLEVFFEFYN